MCSEGGDECILVVCGAAVSAFDADFVEVYFDSLLLLHIICILGKLQWRQWHVG